MAITVTDQRDIVNEADSASGWTGSATVSLFTSEPTAIEDSGCLGMVVSTATQNAHVTVSTIDFTSNPSLIYVWIFHRAELDTRTNGGLMIQLGDGTNRIGFHVAGSDVAGFRHDAGPVGWQCLLLDTGNLPASTTAFAGSLGSLNMGAITQIGVGFKTLVKAVGNVQNCFWDIIRRGTYGQGLLITGGTSGDPATWEQLATADRGLGNQQAYGVVRKLGAGVYGVQGSLTFGDSGTAATYFSDTNATVVFEDRGIDASASPYRITIQGNSTESTTFALGTKIGSGDTATGANGCIIQATSVAPASFTATSTNLQNLLIYGSSLVGFTNGLALSSDATNGPNHEFIGNVVRNCDRADMGKVFVRNCTFSEYAGAEGAMLWNEDIDIKNCVFSNNTIGIEHPSAAGSPYEYDNLRFSANDDDINNTSGSEITVDAINDANPSTFTGDNVVINNPVTYSLTDIVSGSEVRIFRDSDGVELAGTETSGTSLNYNYNYAGDVDIYVVIQKLNFEWLKINDTLESTGKSVKVFQREDRNYENP